MKKQALLLLLFPLLFFKAVAQVELELSVDFDGDGKNEYEGKERVDIDKLPKQNRNTRNDRDRSSSSSSENTYSGPEFIGSWGGNWTKSNEAYYDKISTIGWEKYEAEREALSCLKEMNKLLSEDCIDIYKLNNAIDKYNNLSDYQKGFLGAEGHNARAYLMAQMHNMKHNYFKYSNMAEEIKNFSFGSIEEGTMKPSYEDLDKYLRQFLSKEDYVRSMAEYTKYEKAKVLEKEIDELYNHLGDKSYLRENFDKLEKKMIGVRLLYGLKYVNNLSKLQEVKKVVEYGEIKQIPLTISNIDIRLRSKQATKNNADWKKISEGMTNQRLLSILGTLNSDNDNVLPVFLKEDQGYYCFCGQPKITDEKTSVKIYLVSLDGSEILFDESENVFTNNVFEAKANLMPFEASNKVAYDGDVTNKVNLSTIYDAASAKISIMNTDWRKKEKLGAFSIAEDGSITKKEIETSEGIKAEISGSAKVGFDKTQIAKTGASVSAGIEIANASGELSHKLSPIMHIYPDQSISFQGFRQCSVGLKGGLSAGLKAKASASKKGVEVEAGPVKLGVSVDYQNIDGALKQIDSDVVLGIIKSSIDNGNYKSEFKDESIGKTIASSIRREANDALRKQKR